MFYVLKFSVFCKKYGWFSYEYKIKIFNIRIEVAKNFILSKYLAKAYELVLNNYIQLA